MAHSAETLLSAWLAWLENEKRASPHTIRAYHQDVATSLAFFEGHLGEKINETHLAYLTASDMRALLAHQTREAELRQRLADGAARSRSRHISALRAFYRFLSLRYDIQNAQVTAFKLPKTRKPCRVPWPALSRGKPLRKFRASPRPTCLLHAISLYTPCFTVPACASGKPWPSPSVMSTRHLAGRCVSLAKEISSASCP